MKRMALQGPPSNPDLRESAGWVERVGIWLSSRGQLPGDLQLSQNRIYILPTRPGLLYGAVLACMLLASMNYQLALGYALTFVLGAVGLVTVLHTFRNLNRLMLRPGRAEPVFAGQLAEFSMVAVNPGTLSRYSISFHVPPMVKPLPVDCPANAETVFSLALPTNQRGWFELPRIRLASTFPLGLWRAWSYWSAGMRVLVYPTPEDQAPPLPQGIAGGGQGQATTAGDEEIAGLREYRPGDPLTRVAWKAMARSASEAMLTKLMEGEARGELSLDWYSLPVQLDRELKISRLTKWVLEAEAQGRPYGLRLPDTRIEPSQGLAHRESCLQALALLPR
jgi:uncharacterized protein (DUF58 family)